MSWKDLSSKEKEAVRGRQRATKRRRDQYEAEAEARRKLRNEDDKLSVTFRPGDWLRYRDDWGIVSLQGKIVRFKEWNDDGYNKSRAGRNLKVIVEVEPHLSDEPKTVRVTLGGFRRVNPLEVIASVA